jgi:bifunctional UDP-N-acetylglucosamine pyrophosphorylase/glucosamine-1-phosphate N-acetyltransferase
VPLSVVVLAAGQGKRMRSDLPKVLHPIAGRPMLGHVLERARELQPAGIHVVYGHGGDRVRDAFPATDLTWWLQAEQLGTGHAVAQAMPGVPDDHAVLVLCGDVPLMPTATLAQLTADDRGDFGLLTAMLDDPDGYGRIVRDAGGSVSRIVEQRDASDAERAIGEINTGIMVVEARYLKRWLAALGNDNAQGEYYLTDIVRLAVQDGVAVRAVLAATATTLLGINDKRQLAEAERVYQRARADELMTLGATLADPARPDRQTSAYLRCEGRADDERCIAAGDSFEQDSLG